MNIYKDETQFLILNPTKEDFEEHRILFKNSYDETLYLCQIRELSGDNSYDSYLLFKYQEKIFIFSEYENREEESYHTTISETNEADFWYLIHSLSYNDFFKKNLIEINYQELNKSIRIKEKNLSKKIKI